MDGTDLLALCSDNLVYECPLTEGVERGDVFNEGLDVPEVDTVLMLRPTESPVVFLQQLGRGLRRSRPVLSTATGSPSSTTCTSGPSRSARQYGAMPPCWPESRRSRSPSPTGS